MSFFSDLLADAKAALAVAQPIITIAEDAAPVIATAFPSAAPVINAAEAGAAMIEKAAPGVVAGATSLITQGEALMASAGPELLQLEAIFKGLFTRSPVPQAVVLTPTTSAASVPSTTASQ